MISDKFTNNNVNHTYENEALNLNDLNPTINESVQDARVHDGNYETVTESYNEERARPVYTQLDHSGATVQHRNQQNDQPIGANECEVTYEIPN